MIDIFKKVFGYILLQILKYVPGIQEVCNKEERRGPHSLESIPDIFKTQEMCNQAVRRKPYTLWCVPVHLRTQKMFEKAVGVFPWLLEDIPDRFKKQDMYNKVVGTCSWHLKYVPDWFVTMERVRIWYDYCEYHDDDDEDNFFKWHEGYEKRKAQKESIKKELMPIACHPSRYWDWCMSED